MTHEVTSHYHVMCMTVFNSYITRKEPSELSFYVMISPVTMSLTVGDKFQSFALWEEAVKKYELETKYSYGDVMHVPYRLPRNV